MSDFTYESNRQIKIVHTFDGTSGSGAEDSLTVLTDIPTLDIGEYISDVFYRVTTPFNASGTFYLQAGIKTDDADAALNLTTGILTTLNTNALGIKVVPAYTKCTVDGRDIEVVPKGGDVTVGTIELTLTISRNELVVSNPDSYYSVPDKE